MGSKLLVLQQFLVSPLTITNGKSKEALSPKGGVEGGGVEEETGKGVEWGWDRWTDGRTKPQLLKLAFNCSNSANNLFGSRLQK